MGSLLVDAFLFRFLPDGQIRLHFLCLSDSRHPCRSLFPGFPFPLPLFFFPPFSNWLPLSSALPVSLLPISRCVICLQGGCLFDLLGLFSAEL